LLQINLAIIDKKVFRIGAKASKNIVSWLGEVKSVLEFALHLKQPRKLKKKSLENTLKPLYQHTRNI
jgi:hypothetical protein